MLNLRNVGSRPESRQEMQRISRFSAVFGRRNPGHPSSVDTSKIGDRPRREKGLFFLVETRFPRSIETHPRISIYCLSTQEEWIPSAIYDHGSRYSMLGESHYKCVFRIPPSPFPSPACIIEGILHLRTQPGTYRDQKD